MQTNLNYRVPGTSTDAIFSQMIILSMHLLPQMNVMLDFICMEQVDLPGKFLPTVELEPTTLRFEVWCSTDWANRT